MVSLTFYGGANEIGGNKILLEDKDARIYLDFGESFDFGEDYFYEYLQPRAAHGLEVYFEFGLVPKVPRLYSKKMLERTELKYEKPDIDAIFISHSHSDHVNHISFLDESIPVYMGHGTHRILEAYHKLYPQFVDIGEHTSLNFFKSGDKIKIKHLVIEPIHVEHSIPGAYGFIVHTSKGPLIYTGDLRLHGPKSNMTQEFMEKAAKAKPYAMLCEGTRMGSEQEHNFTEAEVEKTIEGIVKKSKGVVFVYFSMSNIDRFMSVYHAALKNKRKLVIDTKFAFVLDSLKDKIPALPDVMTDENLLVYFRLSKSGTYDEKDYYVYERKFMPKMITFEHVAKNQKKFVMHMSFNKLMELVYLQPKNADYIYSSSEHFLEGEENEAERTVLENWMKHFGVKFHKAHCSGHASKQDLAHLVKVINPKILIPIHTQRAEDFKGLHTNVKIPEKEKTIEI
ncbi:MBL fold metallo-hydrolase [Candidatus Micrarchaeota archaeon]|nr:MBL fold metallo-hydrolase [Candidatus Micrarchaeota archaeon]